MWRCTVSSKETRSLKAVPLHFELLSLTCIPVAGTACSVSFSHLPYLRVLGVRRVVVKCATLSISLTITESQGTERKDSLTSLKIRFIDTHTLMINNIVLYCIEKT